MSKYSFLLSSKEDQYFELTPSIRLKKRGGWLVAEAIEQEEISKAQSQATIRAVQLAKRIAVAKDIGLDEALALLQGGAEISDLELLSDFTEETLQMISNGGSVEAGNARLVTTFIRCRGEGLIDDQWVKLSDWGSEDTEQMTRPVIQKAMEFIISEQGSEEKGKAKKAPLKPVEASPNS